MTLNEEAQTYYKAYPQALRDVIVQDITDIAGELRTSGFKFTELQADAYSPQSPLTLDQYQQRAMTTCMPSCDNFSYMFLNLVGEVGEFASKVAKHIRKEKAGIDNNHLITERGCNALTGQEVTDLRKEAGDIAWQLAGLCQVMGWPLEEVCRENLAKLADRQARRVIDGNGDNR